MKFHHCMTHFHGIPVSVATRWPTAWKLFHSLNWLVPKEIPQACLRNGAASCPTRVARALSDRLFLRDTRLRALIPLRD